MKFEITHSGATSKKGEHKIGEVVEFDSMPGYLLGKCRQLAEVKQPEPEKKAPAPKK